MRQMIWKLAAAVAVVTAASAAPAMACGGGLFSSGCSPCGQAYVSPCGQGYGYGQGFGYGYGGVASYQRLPDPAHQYYYVNQGPTFSGPGNFAPYQTYQETSTPGWTGYERGDGDFDGGGYASRYSYARPYAHARVDYSYQPRVRPSYRYGYGMRPQVRYGYATRSYAPRYGYHHRRFAGPHVMYAPRHTMQRHGHHGHHHMQHQRPMRRMY
ncbi:MAG TPA: hypothetical protein VIQ05_07995 [Tardiphaga sp.]